MKNTKFFLLHIIFTREELIRTYKCVLDKMCTCCSMNKQYVKGVQKCAVAYLRKIDCK